MVEDIVDTGSSLDYIRRNLLARQPRSLSIVALLDKPSRRVTPVEVAYVGFTVPDAFVVGYGLDYQERYRGLPEVGVLTPEEILSGRIEGDRADGVDGATAPPGGKRA